MTPDGLIRWYWATREDLGAPALDFVDSEGRVYNAECSVAKCPSTTRHWKDDGKLWVCGQCGEAWGYEDRFILKGTVDTSVRPGASEARLARYTEIGVKLSVFLDDGEWRWPARYYTAYVLGFSSRELAMKASRAWSAPKCSLRTVQRMVRDGRNEWRRRLELYGIDHD